MAEETAAHGDGARDPAAAAMALSAASRDTADAYLEQQTELARLQAEDLRREDALRHWNLRLANLSQVMKVAFEIAVAFIVLAVASVVAGALWSAVHSDGLVIETFQVPPALAEQGLSGQVVASRIEDKLSTLQAQTDSIRAPSSYQNNWGNDIKVEIPNTGVSIGEFNRYLRAWLGHETHISGEVWRTADGVSVVARAGAEPGTVFTGKESELDALLQKAAEAVYEKTQPYRYAVYLGEKNKTADSLLVLQKLAANSPPSEQAWAYMDWGITLFNSTTEWREALRLSELAVAKDPNNADTYNALALVEGELDREEAQLRDSRTAERLFERGRADFNTVQGETSRLLLLVTAAELTGDYNAAIDVNRKIAERPGFADSDRFAPVEIVTDLAGLHDARGVAQAEPVARQAVGKDDVLLLLPLHMTEFGAEVELEDWQRAIRDYATIEKTVKAGGDAGVASFDIIVRRAIAAQAAYAYARTGDFARAEALIGPTPPDCDSCVRLRGDIAAAHEQWDRAAWWFARTTAQAPSLPFAYEDWGRMLLAKGDAAGAIAKFEISARKGPHFADPLEGWGEALMKQNRSDLALAKFEEAARYAPHWERLHRKWDEARRFAGMHGTDRE